MITDSQKTKFHDLINSAKKILLINSKPDADSIGSSGALNLYISNSFQDKQAESYSPSPLPKRLKFLAEFFKLNINKISSSDYDLVIYLDGVNLKAENTFYKDKLSYDCKFIYLDHHDEQTVPQDFVALIDSSYESTCRVIFDLIGEKIDENIATLLYAGIIDDSGNFTYSKTNSSTIKAAYELSEKGANRDLIVRNLYESLPASAIEILPELIRNSTYNPDLRLRIIKVTSSIQKMFDTDELNQTISFSIGNFFRVLDNTDIICLLRERTDSETSFSLRKRNYLNDINLGEIAKKLGWGGHKEASGGIVKNNLSETETIITSLIAECSKI